MKRSVLAVSAGAVLATAAAVCVLVPGDWAGPWRAVLFGVVVGLVVGAFGGGRVGRLVVAWADRRHALARRRLEIERQSLRARETSLNNEVVTATLLGRREGAMEVKRERAARKKAENAAQALQARVNLLENQLKDAQDALLLSRR